MTRAQIIVKSNAPKMMTKFSFERRLHNLKYFEVGFSFIYLEFIIWLRAKSQDFVENGNLKKM